jgi:hypothetical protein
VVVFMMTFLSFRYAAETFCNDAGWHGTNYGSPLLTPR